jgi:small subunit ribosomal protein S8
MPATNILANMFVTLYNTEARRKGECLVLPTSKLATDVLKTLQHHNYIGEFEHVDDKKGGKFKIQYLPSYSRGMLIVTTNQGVMSHHEAAKSGLGGLLIGFVY